MTGVETPGCDCGHNGMGRTWHLDMCEWARRARFDSLGFTSLFSQIWGARLTEMVEQASTLTEMWLAEQPPLTRRQRYVRRFRNRVYRSRMRLASWVAGFDVEVSQW